MKIIKIAEHNDGYTLDSSKYSEYVKSIERQLPAKALEFMQAPWHYDPSDTRCLHDARLQEILIKELPNNKFRICTITLRLERSDESIIELRYSGIDSYSIEKNECEWPADDYSHGDLMIDEMLLEENGLLTHEVMFINSTFLVKFADFEFSTRNKTSS